MLMEGIFAAVPTPLYPNEQVYYRKLEANLAHYSRSLLAGVLILGSTGEAPLLDDQESIEVLRVAADATAPEKVLIAGVGRESAKATMALAEAAARFSYDVVLVRPPSYFAGQMSTAAVLNYFRSVADHSPLPVLLYNIPKCVPFPIPVEMVAELAQHPNIIGIKDSTGNIEQIDSLVQATLAAPKRTVTVTPVFEAVTGRMLTPKQEPGTSFVSAGDLAGGGGIATAAIAAPIKTRTKEVGFQVLCGSGSAILGSLDKGASGGILAFAAFAPQASYEIYQAWKDHDPKLAEEKQVRIAAANQCIVGSLGIAGVKYACDLNGYFGGRTRTPLLGLTAKEKEVVEALLMETHN